MPSSTHFKIYRIRDLIKRLVKLQNNGCYPMQNQFDALIEIERYKEILEDEINFCMTLALSLIHI